jgi:hypothetical protein
MFIAKQSSNKLVGRCLWKCWRKIKSLTKRRLGFFYRFENLPVTQMVDIVNKWEICIYSPTPVEMFKACIVVMFRGIHDPSPQTLNSEEGNWSKHSVYIDSHDCDKVINANYGYIYRECWTAEGRACKNYWGIAPMPCPLADIYPTRPSGLPFRRLLA